MPNNSTYLDSSAVVVGSKAFDTVKIQNEHAALDKTNAYYRTTTVRQDKIVISVPVLGDTLTYDTDYTVKVFKNGVEQTGTGATVTALTNSKNAVFTIPNDAQVGDTYTFEAVGKGSAYAGSSKTSDAVKVDALADVTGAGKAAVIASNISSTVKNTITLNIPKDNSLAKYYTLDKDYTVSFEKLVTSANGSKTWTPLTDKVTSKVNTDKSVTVSYELSDADVNANTTAYRAVIKGIGNCVGTAFGTGEQYEFAATSLHK